MARKVQQLAEYLAMFLEMDDADDTKERKEVMRRGPSKAFARLDDDEREDAIMVARVVLDIWEVLND